MEPMSLKTRRILAVGSFLLFVIVLPVVALYASGYRLSSGFSLVPTGGVYISVPLSGVSISLNGEELERSSIFSKSFFFDNLEPGSYVIQTHLEGYAPWSKTLTVESRLVTDVFMLAVPQPFRVLEIVATSSEPFPELTATSTMKFVSLDAYDSLAEPFIATTSKIVATSTLPTLPDAASSTEEILPEEEKSVDEQNGTALFIEDGNLRVSWERNSQPPSIFCVKPALCVNSFLLEQAEDTVTDAQFFRGGVLYRTAESGVFFTEVDIRQPRLFITVYSAPDSEYSVINNTLYVWDEETLYEIAEF